MKKTLLSIGLLAAATASQAQTFPAAWAARMQAVLDSVSTVHQDSIGVNAAIYMPGYGMWKGASGLSEPGTPLTTDMGMFIGSNSKLFLAVTMLKLQEQGILNLDDHIGKWITYGPTTVDTTATIRQLLMHESGMADYANDNPGSYYGVMLADTSAIFTARKDVDSAGAPFFPKGRGFHYSNSGYCLCTMIIEAATGQPYWQALRTRVLTPLNMDSTFIPVLEPNQPIASSQNEGVRYTGYGFTSFATASPGNGDLVSTPAEMVQWYQAIFNGSFLSAASREQLLTFEPSSLYGLGIMDVVSPRLGDEYYHAGAVGSFLSETYFDKDTKASMFLSTNVVGGNIYTGMFMAPLLDVFTKEMPKKANDAQITALLSPNGVVCNPSITPTVTLKNNGSAPLTAATIQVKVGATVASTYSWTGTLAPGATTNVTLPATPIANGMHDVKIYTTAPNGAADGYSWNDTFRTRMGANLTTAYNGYFAEGFENAATPVLVWNTRNGMSGQAGISHLSGYNSIHSMARDNFDNSGDYGGVSNVDMPAVTLAAGPASVLSFRYAYKLYPGSDDSLEALISTNCGTTWTSLFNKGGNDLANSDTSYAQYYPQTAAEWKTESISLASYTGNALIRFRLYNANGNNIFVDDIAIGTPTSVLTTTAPELRLYPNPAHDAVTVSGLPEKSLITLSDITGKVLLQTRATGGDVVLDMSKFTPGLYLVSTPLGTQKVVKE